MDLLFNTLLDHAGMANPILNENDQLTDTLWAT